MKIAHLILAHTAPGQLHRMIMRLQHSSAYFFIHIDKKSDIRPFEHLEEIPNVRLVAKRVTVNWGGYSQVQATLNSCEEILGTGIAFDYINLMSGMDYPIKSTSYIHDFLADNPGKIFMRCEPVMEVWKEAIPRITQYHLPDLNIPGRYKLEKILNTVLPARKLRPGIIAAGRAQWFTASRDSIAYVVDYMKNNPWIARHFRLSWGADELMFHTILYNSPFRAAIQADNLMYTDWAEHKASPKTLSMEDLPALRHTDKLFARKFNEQFDHFILDVLDKSHTPAVHVTPLYNKQKVAV